MVVVLLVEMRLWRVKEPADLLEPLLGHVVGLGGLPSLVEPERDILVLRLVSKHFKLPIYIHLGGQDLRLLYYN